MCSDGSDQHRYLPGPGAWPFLAERILRTHLHKGMLLAGKVLAATAIDLIEKPEVLQAAKEEFDKKMKRYGGYFCPVPEGAVPVVPGEKM